MAEMTFGTPLEGGPSGGSFGLGSGSSRDAGFPRIAMG